MDKEEQDIGGGRAGRRVKGKCGEAAKEIKGVEEEKEGTARQNKVFP